MIEPISPITDNELERAILHVCTWNEAHRIALALRASRASEAALRKTLEADDEEDLRHVAECRMAQIAGMKTRMYRAEDQVAALTKERDELKLEVHRIRPLADCYRRVCQSLGITNNILGYVARLRAEQRIPPTMTAELLHAIGDAVDLEFPALSELCHEWEAWLREQPKQQEQPDWKHKIFSHKHLDPRCVESGCRSLFGEPPGLPEGMRYTMVFAVSEDFRRIVLLHKPISHKNPLFRNRWTVPGGHIEAGETDIQGAIREFGEETDVYLNELRFVLRFACNCDATEPEHEVSVFAAVLSEDQLGRVSGDDGIEPVCVFEDLPINTLWYLRPLIELSISRLKQPARSELEPIAPQESGPK